MSFIIKLPGYRDDPEVFVGTVPLDGTLDVALKVFRTAGSGTDLVSLHITTPDGDDAAVLPSFVSSNSTTLSNVALEENFDPQIVTMRLAGQLATRGESTTGLVVGVHDGTSTAHELSLRVAVSNIGVPPAVRMAFDARGASDAGVITVRNTSAAALRLRPSLPMSVAGSLSIGLYHESCCYLEEANPADTSQAFTIPAATAASFQVRLAADHELLPGHTVVPVHFYALDGAADDRTVLLHLDVLENTSTYTATVAEQAVATDVVASTIGLGGSSQIVFDQVSNRIRFLVGGRDQETAVSSAPMVETADSCVRLGINRATGDLEITRESIEGGQRVSRVLLRVDANDGSIRVKSGLIVTDDPATDEAQFAFRTTNNTAKSSMQIVGEDDHVLWEVGPVD